MHGNSSGRSKYLCASTKLIGLMSTIVSLFPRRDSLVARFPPPHPQTSMFSTCVTTRPLASRSEYAFAVGRCLALPHTPFEIYTCAVPRTRDDLDFSVPALVTPQKLQGQILQWADAIRKYASRTSFYGQNWPPQ